MTSGGVELQLRPVANSESAQLGVLRESKILDTLPEPAYDDIADLARTITVTPIAAISIIDGDRVWFKSILGLDLTEIRAEDAFCVEVPDTPEHPLIIPDLSLDPRFQENPFVVGNPHIRFYAGVTLRNPEGLQIGALCVLDTEPRTLTPGQIEGIQRLAKQATTQIELRKAITELEAARKEAQVAVRVKNAFLGNMSHELRTPMNGIIGLTSLLKDTELKDVQKHYLKGIDQSAANLMQVLADVLDYSDLVADRTKLNPATVDLHQLAQELDDLVRPLATSRRLRLVTLVSHSLVDQPLLTDRLRLRQVLLHLLDNAIKFTCEGCVELQIKRVGDVIRFSIRDTGLGVPPEMQQAILDPFTQVSDGTERPRDGVGLGLSTVSEILKLMDSRLGITSVLGGGSTFHFELAAA